MNATANCVEHFKYLVRRSPDQGMSYSERLEFHSREIGFNSYHHFLASLARFSDDRIGKVSTKLMRRACARALPKPSETYYEFIAQRGRRIRFYSHWIGWDQRGQEVRVASSMRADYCVPMRREQLAAPVYIIETRTQLLAWRNKWQGMAYVSSELAKREMRQAFERDNEVIDGIRNKAFPIEEDFISNYATWYPVGT